MARTKEGRRKELQNATRDYTLNMHKRLQGIAFKKRSTQAVRNIKKFATVEMHTQVSSYSFWSVTPSSIFFDRAKILFLRMWESTLSWTDSSGQEVAETSQDLSESESAEPKMRTRKPRRNSTAPSNSSRLSLSLASKPRKDDQSNSCFIYRDCWINYKIQPWYRFT